VSFPSFEAESDWVFLFPKKIPSGVLETYFVELSMLKTHQKNLKIRKMFLIPSNALKYNLLQKSKNSTFILLFGSFTNRIFAKYNFKFFNL